MVASNRRLDWNYRERDRVLAVYASCTMAIDRLGLACRHRCMAGAAARFGLACWARHLRGSDDLTDIAARPECPTWCYSSG